MRSDSSNIIPDGEIVSHLDTERNIVVIKTVENTLLISAVWYEGEIYYL